MYFLKLILLFNSLLYNNLNEAACLPTDMCQYITVQLAGRLTDPSSTAWKYVCNGTEYVQYNYDDTTSCDGEPSSITEFQGGNGLTSDAELTDCDLGCNDYIIFKQTIIPNTVSCADWYIPRIDTHEIIVRGCVNTGWGNSKLFQCNDTYFREDFYEFEDCEGNITDTNDAVPGCHGTYGGTTDIFGNTIDVSDKISFQCGTLSPTEAPSKSPTASPTITDLSQSVSIFKTNINCNIFLIAIMSSFAHFM